MAAVLISPMFATERAENSHFHKDLFVLDLSKHNCRQVQISSFLSRKTLFLSFKVGKGYQPPLNNIESPQKNKKKLETRGILAQTFRMKQIFYF